MDLPKDIYLKLAEFGDDATVIKMLSVNKKFNNPEFFKYIFTSRYPNLIKYKTDLVNWKQFYLQMIQYILKLKEDFSYDFINDAEFKIFETDNPKEIYIKATEALEPNRKQHISRIDRTINSELFYNAAIMRAIKNKRGGQLVKGTKIFAYDIETIIKVAKKIGNYSIINLWGK